MLFISFRRKRKKNPFSGRKWSPEKLSMPVKLKRGKEPRKLIEDFEKTKEGALMRRLFDSDVTTLRRLKTEKPRNWQNFVGNAKLMILIARYDYLDYLMRFVKTQKAVSARTSKFFEKQLQKAEQEKEAAKAV